MKKSTGVILVLIIVLLLGVIGVGGYFFIKGSNDTSKEIGALKNEIANLNKGSQNQANENNTSIENNNEVSKESSNSTNQTNTALTTAELKDLEDYLNKLENNGFVSHNLYSDVNNIDLKMVFYNIGTTDIHKEELEKVLNGEEQLTAIYKITIEQIKSLYSQKTGKNISDEEIKSRFKDAKYDEESGSFFLQHGDTSAMNVKCVNGYKTVDGLYKVILKDAVVYDKNSKEVKDTILTVKKEGNSYKFISHVINSYAE